MLARLPVPLPCAHCLPVPAGPTPTGAELPNAHVKPPIYFCTPPPPHSWLFLISSVAAPGPSQGDSPLPKSWSHVKMTRDSLLAPSGETREPPPGHSWEDGGLDKCPHCHREPISLPFIPMSVLRRCSPGWLDVDEEAPGLAGLRDPETVGRCHREVWEPQRLSRQKSRFQSGVRVAFVLLFLIDSWEAARPLLGAI